MSKTRVYELAREFGIESKEFITKIEKLGIAVKSHSSTLSDDDVERIRRELTLGERKVVEERVKSTVIRRRRVVKEQAAPAEPFEASEAGEAPAEGEMPPQEKELRKGKPADAAAVAPEEKRRRKQEKEQAIEEGPPEKAAPREPEAPAATETSRAAREQEAVSPVDEKKEPPKEKGVPQKAPAPSIEKRGAEERTPEEERQPPVSPDVQTGDAAEREVEKKKKRSVEVVVDERPTTKKKAAVRQRVERKARRIVRDIDDEQEAARRGLRKQGPSRMKKTEITTPKAIKKRVKVGDAIKVGDLAKKMGVKANEVIAKLISLGMMVTINQSIDFDVASLVATEFGYQIEQTGFDYDEVIQYVDAAPDKLLPRAPVVTVMGHVDHGKTSLLDAIRETRVMDGEAGGITQAIGAYHVHINERDIVFVDTPGHEAFTSMRARGAQVTDIVVLIVAADDGVMDQTIEAINHSKAAGVPMIVAINKIDKPGANPDHIKQRLSDLGLVPEEWGGDTIYAEISAKMRIGIENLLELILLQADIMELKADPDRLARGIIVEASLDKGRGPVATVIIQEGTLHEGDAFVSKTEYGRVRALMNDKGQRVASAGPSMPVEVIGFSKVPRAGIDFVGVEDEKKARSIADYLTMKEREKELSQHSKITLEQLYDRIKEGAKEFNVIIKGDVHGSIEAITEALLRLSTDDVKLKIIHSSTGTVTETDVLLASASDAIIIGFNIRPDSRVAETAEKEGVEIKLYDVIYDAINDVKAAMAGLLEPLYRDVVQGRAEVRDLFKIPKIGTIAGSYVLDGKMVRNSNLRLVRDGIIVYDGKMVSLKRFKDDAREVQSGFECGVGLDGFNDIRVGDIIESYVKQEVERTLD